MGNFHQYTTSWAESTFRPLLDSIDFANLNLLSVPLVIYNKLEQYIPALNGIKCCLVFITNSDSDLEDHLGYSMFKFFDNTYSLIIRLSKDLFKGGKHDDPMIRNIIGIHEFLHCISALICIPDLTNSKGKMDSFIKEYNTKMMLEILSIEKLEKIRKMNHGQTMGNMPDQYILGNQYFFPNSIFFSDDHYRLSSDESPLKYHNLHERLLLPRDKFEKFFNKSELQKIKSMINTNKLTEVYSFAQSKGEKIAHTMHLEIPFVIRRISEILISYAI
jgi:hypothetical protein